ncbi:MAG: efflux RND transporter periplasmic adaptor subunit [Hydrogeniiclostridium mannosilyticum]
MRKKWLPILAGIVLLSCTSCTILPEEEELPAAPVVRDYEVEEYEQTPVLRGDLQLSQKVSCTYRPAKSEDLSFALGGEYISAVYVETGQTVKKGQLLAELEQGNIDEQIEAQEYTLSQSQVKLKHAKEDKALDLQKQELLCQSLEEQLQAAGQDTDTAALKSQLEAQRIEKSRLTVQYDNQIEALNDDIYIQNKKLSQLRQEKSRRQIYASIDGTATYVQQVEEGERSVKDERFITISDMETSVFVVKGEDCEYFKTGDEVDVVYKKEAYPARVVDASSLGLTEQEEGEARCYLQLLHPNPELESGNAGAVNVVLDERKGVLYTLAEAVKTANGQKIVYCLDENGMKIMKNVETGLKAGEWIEIVSGLEEGDSVVLDS